MENETTAAHFHKLFDLILKTQVTNREGQLFSLEEGMTKAVQMISSLGPSSNKALLIGNGGSAAVASHMQNDLCKAAGVRAMVFNEPPLLTALTNDHGYESAFERLVELWAEANDLLIAISSSGRSENILRAARAAAKRQCQILTFSGFRSDNPLRSTGDINFYIASESYGAVEVAHTILMHSLTDRVMASMLAGKDTTAS